MFARMSSRQFVSAAKQIFEENKELEDITERTKKDLKVAQNMRQFIDDESFLPTSAIGNLSIVVDKLLLVDEDKSDSEDEDELIFSSDPLYEYLNEIENISFDLNDDTYVMKGNMSENLRRLFDINETSISNNKSFIINDWKPPTHFGLTNSEPIIRIATNVAEEKNSFYRENSNKK